VRLIKTLGQAGGGFLQVVRSGLFRPCCPLCGRDLVQHDEHVICRDCREKIRPAAENQCPVCGRFVPEEVAACVSCLLEPPPFDRHVSYAAYEATLREAIILFKYGEIEPLKHLLAELCLEAFRWRMPGRFDAVVPVPADRGRRRGFQPVRAMGGILSRRLGIPYWPRALRKKKSTAPQVGLSLAQRRTNLDGAFELVAAGKLAGRNVLLLDDVTTTGTTIRKCAAVLRKGGARVSVITLAQTRY